MRTHDKARERKGWTGENFKRALCHANPKESMLGILGYLADKDCFWEDFQEVVVNDLVIDVILELTLIGAIAILLALGFLLRARLGPIGALIAKLIEILIKRLIKLATSRGIPVPFPTPA